MTKQSVDHCWLKGKFYIWLLKQFYCKSNLLIFESNLLIFEPLTPATSCEKRYRNISKHKQWILGIMHCPNISSDEEIKSIWTVFDKKSKGIFSISEQEKKRARINLSNSQSRLIYFNLFHTNDWWYIHKEVNACYLFL